MDMYMFKLGIAYTCMYAQTLVSNGYMSIYMCEHLNSADGTHLAVQVRLNFLTTLIGEGYNHLHNHMCASVLGRKLFTLPFDRDVTITAAGAKKMQASLLYCQQVIVHHI